MRIPPLAVLALACAACDPFFDPDIGEGEGEFDGIPEEPFHDDGAALPDLPDLDVELQNLRVQALEDPDLVEVRPVLVGVPFVDLGEGLVAFEIDGRPVEGGLVETPDGLRVLGLVEWTFAGDGAWEAEVTADVVLDR